MDRGLIMSKITVERSIHSLYEAKEFLHHIGFYDCLSNEPFVQNVVKEAYLKDRKKSAAEEIKTYELLDFCAEKLYEVEQELYSMDATSNTMSVESLRDKDCRFDSDRDKLKDQIIKDCLSLKREDDETKIRLGNGGILPKTELQFGGRAVICIGGPASGKSGFCTTIADALGALTLDSDIIKKKLPEFASSCIGASLVHKESQHILDEIFENAIPGKTNVVYPIIGKKYEAIQQFISKFTHYGYKVSVILIMLDKRQTACRAFTRYIQTGRYVPIPYVLDSCGNESAISFYRSAAEDRDGSFLCIDNNSNKPLIDFEQNCEEIRDILIESKRAFLAKTN
jgi:hypothetical protein